MGNKVKLIKPFLMLLAGSLASIIMYIRKYDFYTMLWVLLVVLVVFYIIGDVVRYIYAAIRPRIIPSTDEKIKVIAVKSDSVAEREEDEPEEDPGQENYNEDEASEEEYDSAKEYEDDVEEEEQDEYMTQEDTSMDEGDSEYSEEDIPDGYTE